MCVEGSLPPSYVSSSHTPPLPLASPRPHQRATEQRKTNAENLKKSLSTIDHELELLDTIRTMVNSMHKLRPLKKAPLAPPADDVDTTAIMFAATKARSGCISDAKDNGLQAPFVRCEEAFKKAAGTVEKEILAQTAPKKA